MRQGYASFSDRFDKLAPGRADRLAIREDGLDWRYADVYARSVTVSDALRDLGIRAGHAVALMAPNSGAFVSAFVGIARAGGVISPFNVRYQQQELVYYLRDTRASAIIAASGLVPVVAEVLATLEDPPSLVEVVADGSCRVVGPPREGLTPSRRGALPTRTRARGPHSCSSTHPARPAPPSESSGRIACFLMSSSGCRRHSA